MIKVYFDTNPLEKGHAFRGIGYYTKNLLSELRNNTSIKIVDNIEDADIVHYPYFDFFFNTLTVPNKPTIVTVFDTIPLIYPENYPPGIKGKINLLRQKKELKKAKVIITISETSKKDIVRFLDIPEEKVKVIYLAATKQFKRLKKETWQKQIRSKYNLPEKFVLYVGDVNYNKNVVNLAKATVSQNITLVIVGKQAAEDKFDRNHIENRELKTLIDEFGKNPNVLKLGFVSDEDLVKIYNLATVYCQPSLYEGFGLAVLEAQSCGTPTVAVRNQCIKEIYGETCLYSEEDDKSIASRLEEILNDYSLRTKMITEGYKNVRKYSWLKTTSKTINIYEEVFKNN